MPDLVTLVDDERSLHLAGFPEMGGKSHRSTPGRRVLGDPRLAGEEA